MRSKLAVIILIIVMLMSAMLIPISSISSAAPVPSNPIAINGDAMLSTTASANGWLGNGTASDPYIIANLNIDANGGYAITLDNTNLYVDIENCTITHSSYSFDIEMSSNITIENNTMVGSSGYSNIYLYWSDNNTILNNIVNGDEYGLCFISSNNNLICNNAINNASNDGIFFQSSNDNIISNNTIGGVYEGIYLDWYSNNDTISNNNLTESGIDLNGYSDNNTASNNNLTEGDIDLLSIF